MQQPSTSNRPLLTTAEAAQHLRVNRRHILDLINRGLLKPMTVAGSRRGGFRFRAEDVEALLTPYNDAA